MTKQKFDLKKYLENLEEQVIIHLRQILHKDFPEETKAIALIDKELAKRNKQGVNKE